MNKYFWTNSNKISRKLSTIFVCCIECAVVSMHELYFLTFYLNEERQKQSLHNGGGEGVVKAGPLIEK